MTATGVDGRSVSRVRGDRRQVIADGPEQHVVLKHGVQTLPGRISLSLSSQAVELSAGQLLAVFTAAGRCCLRPNPASSEPGSFP